MGKIFDRRSEPLAQRFSKELKKSLAAREMSQRDLADELGCGQPMIVRYVSGRTIPMLDRAKEMSEILANETLLLIAKEWAKRECVVCKTPFYTASLQMKAIYCSGNCKGIAFRQARKGQRDLSRKFAHDRLKLHIKAVRDFCTDCTAGDGICRDDECHLRGVSPMPFIPITGFKHGGLAKRKAS